MIILYLKSIHLFMDSGFLVSHSRLCKPRHFYGLSPLGTMFDHNWRVFHLREDLSLFVDTRHIFSLPFYSTVRLCWTLSHLPSPHNQTPNTVSIYQPCTNTHLMRCPRAYECKMSLHVISCYMHNECYMDNTIHITYRCHEQSHHLHMTSINHFIHVNLSCKLISTCHSMIKQ